MKEPTEHELQVIRERQLHCTHAIIKGACDKEPRCVHCGISQADAEQMSQTVSVLSTGWIGHQGGVP